MPEPDHSLAGKEATADKLAEKNKQRRTGSSSDNSSEVAAKDEGKRSAGEDKAGRNASRHSPKSDGPKRRQSEDSRTDAQRQLHRFAVPAVVLSGAGILCVTAVTGIVLGAASIIQTSAQRKKYRFSWHGPVAIAAGSIWIVVVTLLVRQFVVRSELASRPLCRQNLSAIHVAMESWAEQHLDRLPSSLRKLLQKSELISPVQLHCPSLEGQGYVLRPVPDMTLPGELIIVHDRRGAHRRLGRYVLYLDGRIEWVPEQRFDQLIASDNKLRKQLGLKPLPPNPVR